MKKNQINSDEQQEIHHLVNVIDCRVNKSLAKIMTNVLSEKKIIDKEIRPFVSEILYDVLDNKILEFVSLNDITTAVSNIAESQVDGVDVEGIVGDEIRESVAQFDFEDIAESKIKEMVQHEVDFESLVTTAIDEKISYELNFREVVEESISTTIDEHIPDKEQLSNIIAQKIAEHFKQINYFKLLVTSLKQLLNNFISRKRRVTCSK